MRGLNVQNIRLSRGKVAKTSGGAYAAITCAGIHPVRAIVMAAGDDANETSRLRDNLNQEIAGIINFD